MAPVAASPEAITQFDPGTRTRSSGPTRPQMNWTFPAGSHPAARGAAAPWGNAKAIDKGSTMSTFIPTLRGRSYAQRSNSDCACQKLKSGSYRLGAAVTSHVTQRSIQDGVPEDAVDVAL